MAFSFSKLKDRFDPVVFFVTLVSSLLVTVVGAILYVQKYVDSEIESLVAKRVAPYETYLAANSYFNNDDPDRCLGILSPLITEIDSAQYKAIKKEPLFDLFIACSRDARGPGEQVAMIRQIENKIEEGKVATSAWHSGALGWFYLRTGDIARSKAYFERGVSQFSAENNKVEEGNTRWGMTLIALLERDVPRAVEQYRLVSSLNPARFSLSSREAPIISELNTPWLGNLRDNANVRSAMPEFMAAIRRLPIERN